MMWENLFTAGVIFLWAAFALAAVLMKPERTLPHGLLLGLIPLAAHSGWIAYRTVLTGHVPFATIYESLFFFGFLLFCKALPALRKRAGTERLLLLLPGIAVLSVALVLPDSLKASGPLAPALQSPWMFVHVPAVFFAYVSLCFAFASKLRDVIGKREGGEFYDREIKQAFFFLSVGIVSGAFWAAASWGAFWSWDPKEAWSLATWFLAGLALHLKSERGKLIAVSLAFAAMLFTYFGVTFLLPGLHAYLR